MNHLTNEGLFALSKYCTLLTNLAVAGKLNFNSAHIATKLRRQKRKADKKLHSDKKPCVHATWRCAVL